jgi:hypothetical protein
MPYSGMRCRVGLVKIDVLEVCYQMSNTSTLKMEATRSSETSVFTGPTRRHIPEDGILHSHRRENLKSNIRVYDVLNANQGGTVLYVKAFPL